MSTFTGIDKDTDINLLAIVMIEIRDGGHFPGCHVDIFMAGGQVRSIKCEDRKAALAYRAGLIDDIKEAE